LKFRSDHGGEFENESFETFCEKHGLSMNFLLLELHSKMGLQRERIEPYKKWKEP